MKHDRWAEVQGTLSPHCNIMLKRHRPLLRRIGRKGARRSAEKGPKNHPSHSGAHSAAGAVQEAINVKGELARPALKGRYRSEIFITLVTSSLVLRAVRDGVRLMGAVAGHVQGYPDLEAPAVHCRKTPGKMVPSKHSLSWRANHPLRQQPRHDPRRRRRRGVMRTT